MSITSNGLGVNLKLEGVRELVETLKEVGGRGAKNGAKAAMRAGQKPILQQLRQEVRTQAGKVTGILQKSPGQSVDSTKEGVVTGKVGINVGTKRGGYRITGGVGKTRRVNARKTAPHAHLLALGTKTRQTKSGANRGRIEKRPMVPAAVSKTQSTALHAMEAKLKERIQAEVVKARKS